MGLLTPTHLTLTTSPHTTSPHTHTTSPHTHLIQHVHAAPQLRDSDRRIRTASPGVVRRGPLARDQSILSDHGICVSFDEEVSKRRSSSLLCTGNYTLLSDQQQRSITVKLPLEMNGELEGGGMAHHQLLAGVVGCCALVP